MSGRDQSTNSINSPSPAVQAGGGERPPIIQNNEEESMSDEERRTLVDVFRTLLELDRKYGGDIEKKKSHGSDHHQPS